MNNASQQAMDAVVDHVQRPVITNPSEWEESYKPLPCLFFGLLIIWVVLVFAWTFNTWTKRQLQVLAYILDTEFELKQLVP